MKNNKINKSEENFKILRPFLSSNKADIFLRRLLMFLGTTTLYIMIFNINDSIREVVHLEDPLKGVIDQSDNDEEERDGKDEGKSESESESESEGEGESESESEGVKRVVDLSEFEGNSDLRFNDAEYISVEDNKSLEGIEIDGEYSLTTEDISKLRKVSPDDLEKVKVDKNQSIEKTINVPREILEARKVMVRNIFVDNFQKDLIDKYALIDKFSPQEMRNFFEDFLLHIESARIVAEEVGEDYAPEDLIEAKIRAVKTVDKLKDFVEKHSKRIGVSGSVVDRAKKISGLIANIPYVRGEAYPTNLFNLEGSSATNCDGKSMIAAMLASNIFANEIKEDKVQVAFESMNSYDSDEQRVIPHIRLALQSEDNDLIVDAYFLRNEKNSLKTSSFKKHVKDLLGVGFVPGIVKAHGPFSTQIFSLNMTDPNKIVTVSSRDVANLEENVSDKVSLEEVEKAVSFFSKDISDIKNKSRDNVDFKRRLKKMLVEKINSFEGNLDLNDEAQRAKFKSIDTLMEYYLFHNRYLDYTFNKLRVVGSSVENNKFISGLHVSYIKLDYYPNIMLGLFEVSSNVFVYIDEVKNPYVFDGEEELKFLWKVNADKLNDENIINIPAELEIIGKVDLDVWKFLAKVKKEQTILITEMDQVNLSNLIDLDLSKINVFFENPRLNSTVLGLRLKELRIWGEKRQLEFILDNLEACRFEVLYLYEIRESDIDMNLLKKIAEHKEIVVLSNQKSMSKQNFKKFEKALSTIPNISMRDF